MNKNIIDICKHQDIDARTLLAFISVETGGKGFDDRTGKIIIQFEPSWFKKEAPYAPSGLWSVNKVDVQAKEWLAFNDAFRKNPSAAMESTSIGLGQIMGFQYKRLGYKSVNEMWDDAKKGILQQVGQIVKFIKTDKNLELALKNKNWSEVAKLYNGSGYKELAKKYNRLPYDQSMQIAYDKFKNI